MIILTKAEHARVRAGLQTMAIQTGQERRWALGGLPHPLQRGAFGPVDGYARLISVVQLPLKALTELDAQRLGYTMLDSFKSDWRRAHGRWRGNLMVWAIRFVVAGPPEEYRQSTLLDRLEE